jgi:hypothetical protein
VTDMGLMTDVESLTVIVHNVKLQLYASGFYVLCNFTNFLYGPSQMLIRTMLNFH